MWTGPVILTLLISCAAIIMSGAALGWQIVSWRRSGPRITVKRIQGIGDTPQGIWFTGVEAVNSGRLGTKIQQFGFQLADGHHISAIEDFVGQPILLPMDLAPGDTASVLYSASGIRHALDGHQGAGARPYVETGHGRFEGEPIDLTAEVDLLCRDELQ